MTQLSRSPLYKLRRYAFRFWNRKIRINARRSQSRGEPVTILLPVIAKDLAGLEHTLASIRHYLRHPIERVVIVSPVDAKIAKFAKDNDAEHIVETDMLPRAMLDINAHTKDSRKIGWIRQQMIKMYANEYLGAQRILTCDSDTVFIQNVSFETENGKMILFQTEEYRPSYEAMVKTLLGIKPLTQFNHVAHCMMFDKDLMQGLKEAITAHCGQDWVSAIKSAVESEESGDLSEFELYASYAKRTYPDKLASRYWYNRKVKPQVLSQWKKPPQKVKSYNFLSSHIH